jgi:predicted kinase
MSGVESAECEDYDDGEAGVGPDRAGGTMNTRIGRRLIIVCGLPGSGKTTLAKAIEGRLGAIRFSPDEWMDDLSLDLYDEERRGKIEGLQWKLGQQLLALGLVVIIEWGTWGRSEREALRLGARALGAAVELHYLSAPEDILFERIERRRMESPPIEREMLRRWSEIFEAPTREEMDLYDKPAIADIESGLTGGVVPVE